MADAELAMGWRLRNILVTPGVQLSVEVYDGNSVVKVHNAIVKITGHYKPPGHFKKPVSFSANTRLNGFVKFTDIPLDLY
jgi:hypothetical protein